MADAVVMLEVPIAQKDEAKALGARWDPAALSWYVPAGRDATPFARWLPPPVRIGGPTIPARLLHQAERCYRCAGRGTAVTGILVPPRYSLDPCGFIGFDFIARALAALVNDTPVAERLNIGRIRMRSSVARPEGYIANACRYCDALWGSFPLQEAVTEYLAEGGSYDRLVIGELAFPAAELPDLRSGWDDEEDDWGDEDDETDDELAPSVAAPSLPPTAAILGNEHRRAQPGARTAPAMRAACGQQPTAPAGRGWRPWRR